MVCIAAKHKIGQSGILKTTAVFCTVCFLSASVARGDIIQGLVTDTVSGAPLDSVKVMVENNPHVFTFTNASGKYALNTANAAISGCANSAPASISFRTGPPFLRNRPHPPGKPRGAFERFPPAYPGGNKQE